MDVVQLGLLVLALTGCAYDNDLQECLQDQGVNLIFEVSTTIDNMLWDEVSHKTQSLYEVLPQRKVQNLIDITRDIVSTICNRIY